MVEESVRDETSLGSADVALVVVVVDVVVVVIGHFNIFAFFLNLKRGLGLRRKTIIASNTNAHYILSTSEKRGFDGKSRQQQQQHNNNSCCCSFAKYFYV